MAEAVELDAVVQGVDLETRQRLMAITPIDGRYGGTTDELSPIVSEFGLFRYRYEVMGRWFSKLISGVLPNVEPISDIALDAVHEAIASFGIEDAVQIKRIEAKKNHDVQATGAVLKANLSHIPEVRDLLGFVHYPQTSEDPNSMAYGLMFRDVRDKVIVPHTQKIVEGLEQKALSWADIPLLSLTHGQAATPTTLGKEMRVFSERLRLYIEQLRQQEIKAKWSGATGNFAAGMNAYPDVNWPAVSRQFIESFGLTANMFTTQIEPHDWIADYFHKIMRGNAIKIDLATDIWGYISRGVMAQIPNPDEDGSSAMPNKVNPIDYENAEGNAGLANALLGHLALKLPVSRFQRDLSDSTALRGASTAFGHTLLVDVALAKGLGKVVPNKSKIGDELFSNWTVLAEAVQTVMRREGVDGAYDIVKRAVRGHQFSGDDYIAMVKSLPLPLEAKEELLALTPANYIGNSATIAKAGLV